jgi:peptidyl-prolyl cis-trans isomerase D
MFLEKIRGTSGNIVFKALMLMVVVSFVIWGVGDYIGGGPDVVATVGNTNISRQEFMEARKAEIIRIKQAVGVELSEEDIIRFDIDKRVLNDLINNRLISLEHQSLGLSISDELVADNIKNNKVFHNKDGVFDKNIFHRVLNHNHISEADYVSSIKKELASSFLVGTFDAMNISSDEFTKQISEYLHEKRKVDLVKVSFKGSKADVAPSEAEVKEYYESHKSLYKDDEYRDLSYVYVDSKPLGDKFYELSKEAEDELAAGSTIEEIAQKLQVRLKQVSMVNAKGEGKDSKIHKDVPKYDGFLEAGFGLREGDEPEMKFTPGQDGFYIVTVSNVYLSTEKSFERAKGEITSLLELQKEVEITSKATDEIMAKFKEKKDIIKVVNDMNEEIIKVSVEPGKTILRKDIYSQTGQGLPASMLVEIFDLNKGEVGSKHKIQSGYSFVIAENTDSEIDVSKGELEELSKQVESQFNAIIVDEYIRALYQRYSVSIKGSIRSTI